MRQTTNRKHYRVGRKVYQGGHQSTNCCDTFSGSYHHKHSIILVLIIYVLSNIISFMLGSICGGKRYR